MRQCGSGEKGALVAVATNIAKATHVCAAVPCFVLLNVLAHTRTIMTSPKLHLPIVINLDRSRRALDFFILGELDTISPFPFFSSSEHLHYISCKSTHSRQF
jgi:hypothetical protein